MMDTFNLHVKDVRDKLSLFINNFKNLVPCLGYNIPKHSSFSNSQAMGEKNHEKFQYSSFLMLLGIILLPIKGALSEVYTVGDAEQWNSGVNYGSWSQKYKFTVGDILVFQYTKAQHNVYEVTEETYQSCDPSTGVVFAKYESGNDQVELNKAKKYWFMCNVDGHCLGGMRFTIDVKAPNGTSNSTNGALAPEPEPPTTPPKSSASFAFGRWSLLIYLVCLALGLHS
ncbi:hypothetical protein Tsubulata_013683 [Turnera subulata]|uniref:Phytocyanin domain-containing protein n=1 Tax=Turnera subulata TaxID=218843 RepID=A0A9Q0FN70_9ROSI|nr:hypothetical protein Tsubulata_013683 [Turnera subulata]